MIPLMRVTAFLAALLITASAWSQPSDEAAPLPDIRKLEGAVPEGAIVVIPLKGEVSKAQFYFLRRVLKAGEAANASAFILDMDTPGGELGAGVDILQALLKAKAPTLTYVDPNAGSAGALIALGTKQIWMAPVSAIGAAAPVMGMGQEVPETLNAKIVSYFSGYFRSAAERNGHNPELAEAFINKEKQVKIGGRVINEKGELLTLSAQEAAEKINGKPLLAAGIAESVADLVRKAGLAAPVVEAEPARNCRCPATTILRSSRISTETPPLLYVPAGQPPKPDISDVTMTRFSVLQRRIHRSISAGTCQPSEMILAVSRSSASCGQNTLVWRLMFAEQPFPR